MNPLSQVTYMGSISTTVDGRECNRWNSSHPELHHALKAAMPDLQEWKIMETNYCRYLVLDKNITSKLKVSESFRSPWCLVDGSAHLCVTPEVCGMLITTVTLFALPFLCYRIIEISLTMF